MVRTQGDKIRVWATNIFLIGFVLMIMFPLVMVISISLRPGDFSRGSLIPERITSQHWVKTIGKTFVGMSYAKTVFTSDSTMLELNIGQMSINDQGEFTLNAEPRRVRHAEATEHYPLESFIELQAVDEFGDILATSNKIQLFIYEQDAPASTAEVLNYNLGDTVTGKLDISGLPAEYAKLSAYYGKSAVEPAEFPVLTWLWNSVKIAVIAASLILLLSVSAAYAFARLKFKFKNGLMRTLLVIQMFPAILGIIALYALFDRLSMYVSWLAIDTHGAYIVALLGGIVMNMYMIIGYMQTIDVALEESAAIDGATPFQTFVIIMLPLSVPILAVVFILAFIGIINELPLASALIKSQDLMTLAIGSRMYFSEQNIMWGDYAATAVLSGVPITAVFLAGQRFLKSGLTAGGVKG